MELSISNLKKILANSSSLGDDVLNFNDDVSITEQGVDSLDMLDYFLNLEEAYNVKIPDTDIEKVKTFAALFQYLKEKMDEVQNS
ncbi:MAG TPA: acyl carrier protein [Parafilimonas sp.]|nr:acyl carrier protein [Parafilimonas sp.]